MATYNVISIEQDREEMETRVHFEENGEKFVIASSCDYRLLDDDGDVITDSPDESHIKLYNWVATDYCGEDCILNEEYSV